MRFRDLWEEIAPIGRTDHGYLRYAWSGEDMALREWFAAQASRRGLFLEEDGNGNLFAWWGPRSGGAILTGSHFDSVPGGGGYDGPLGIVSGFLALDELRARGVRPARPIGVAAFVEEEGSRFGVACLGSRLLIGAIDPERALALRDRDGITLAEAMAGQGADPSGVRPRPDLVASIDAFVELHVEQGRALAEMGAPVGVGTDIWPHGRWRMVFTGEGNHAGTTPMDARRDPMLTYAYAVLAANKQARLLGGHATVGRVSARPNATNAVPAGVTGWLDARAADADALAGLVGAIRAKIEERAARDRVEFAMTEESTSRAVRFDAPLVESCVRAARRRLPEVPRLATAAGHDAGVLARHVPAAMLFVRNPTGVSHAPSEHATDADCAAGVSALADVLEELAAHR
ncbi:MAG: allantoate amidohydrolase [Micromonosporaceae bacterium]|jgi:N-carbamoyl-L-amino-acid hydrolase|nr:allantoate amidohydrolase [Micromonosporaceae bacterium]